MVESIAMQMGVESVDHKTGVGSTGMTEFESDCVLVSHELEELQYSHLQRRSRTPVSVYDCGL